MRRDHLRGAGWNWLDWTGEMTYEVIRKLEAEDVCQVYHGLVFREIDFWSSDIYLDTIDLFMRPLSHRGIGVFEPRNTNM